VPAGGSAGVNWNQETEEVSPKIFSIEYDEVALQQLLFCSLKIMYV